ncbi:galactosylgalactosylxylosylprotein 3-beta-glucuronosyltransferase 1 [Biomphalaria pfeifferi]|uniref:Galactosylgalactosylxylosylprotein 3-beta-glucuronosyltransferase n=1 Tax=Biomphalaria pfeifferi TaxID=112525 RepID=A0AAD8F8S6_BIOPF|nr:galactosylgalactosylxylosylprotein 3-beta-glucuronosyltransferase 1 [Biomphalaria pfeifferi]
MKFLENKRDNQKFNARSLKSLSIIYVITPTYARLEQKAELTRLSHTLLHVPNIHWIVIEDSPEKTALVQNFLNRTRIHSTHLYVATPSEYKMNRTDPHWLKPRGVLQRNAALDWLRNNTSPDDDGVVYFADDDNTYSLPIFEELGLAADLRYERPKVTNGKVTGWYTYRKPNRPFATDMAGFAINLNLIHQHPKAKFSNTFGAGRQESTFLTFFNLTLDELEPKANMCTQVLVWHTRTERSKTPYEEAMVKLYGADAYSNIEV